MPEVFVGAGSNADPERRLLEAVEALERRFGAVRCSRVYRSPAVGVAAADYLNLVAGFDAPLPVDALTAALREIEALAGRSRAAASVCELDLDLLVYGERVDAERRLPRPGLFTVPFVAVPLAELAPQLKHPLTGQRCAAAASALARAPLVDVGALGARR